MMPSALLGGLFIGVLSALPIINIANCCCLWMILGGALAAHLDRQADPSPTSIGRGALAGLAAGAVGAVVWLVTAMALSVVLGPLQERMASVMIQNARDMPPDVRAWLESIGSGAASPFRWVLNFIFYLFVDTVFGALGGALAAMFFRRDAPPPGSDGYAAPPPIPPSL